MTPSVNVYTVTWCPHCIRCLQFLDAVGVAYCNHDVDADDAIWKRALALTGQIDIVPVVEVGGLVHWGAFDATFEHWIREHAGGTRGGDARRDRAG